MNPERSLNQAFWKALCEADTQVVWQCLHIDPTLCNLAGSNGEKPLHVANSAEMVALLLVAGADINGRSLNGMWTPLHGVAYGGKSDLVELLIEHGAIVDAVDEQGQTPLSIASNSVYTSAVPVLLKHGANPNLNDKDGFVPLHHALLDENIELVDILLKNGANPNAQTSEGHTTPLHMAAIQGSEELIQLLLQFGARADLTDNLGGTAKDWARDDAIRLLLE